MNCPCGSNLSYSNCCELIHNDIKMAKSAEMLMRSRYSAFVLHNIDFIYNSFHPSTRRFQNKKDIEQWAIESKWMHLNIIKASQNIVEFEAHYLDTNFEPQVHHEKSSFKQYQGIWYYVDGKLTNMK